MSAKNVPAEKNDANVSKQERPFEGLMRELHSRAKLEGSAFEIASQVIDAIAQADSVEAIFEANESGPTSLKENEHLHKVNLNITDARYHKSAEKFAANNLGVFVTFDAYLDSGDEVMVSTGAPNVVASLYRAQREGWLSTDKPLRCRIVPKDSANGVLLTVGRPA